MHMFDWSMVFQVSFRCHVNGLPGLLPGVHWYVMLLKLAITHSLCVIPRPLGDHEPKLGKDVAPQRVHAQHEFLLGSTGSMVQQVF
jgi:hypothetical protein